MSLKEVRVNLENIGFNLENYRFLDDGISYEKMEICLSARRAFLASNVFSYDELEPMVEKLVKAPELKPMNERGSAVIPLAFRDYPNLNKLAPNDDKIFIDEYDKFKHRLVVAINPYASKDEIFSEITKQIQHIEEDRKERFFKGHKRKTDFDLDSKIKEIVKLKLIPYMDLMIVNQYHSSITQEEMAEILGIEHNHVTHKRLKEKVNLVLDNGFLNRLLLI